MPNNEDSRREVTVADLQNKILAKILADHGLTIDDLLENENAHRRPNYLKRAISADALHQPSPDEEADIMASRVNINLNGGGHRAIADIVANQERYSTYTDNYKNYMLVKKAPKPLLWLAKFLLFLKRPFRRKK